jgi:hypothetical protein
VELAEQRLRMAEPGRSGSGVRRGRSSAGSTRTHSIRRTSLRDKMKTTKKDVAEEGLIYMKSVTQSPPSAASANLSDVVDSSQDNVININNNNNNTSSKEELFGVLGGGAALHTTSTPSSPSSSSSLMNSGSNHTNKSGHLAEVVDLADVQISLAGSYPPTPSAAAASTTPSQKKILPPLGGPVGPTSGRPVQHVAPTVVKAKPPLSVNGLAAAAVDGTTTTGLKSSSPPPVRPARLMDRRQSSVEETLAAAHHNASLWTSSSSPNVTGNSGEPINIHVSVTINPPPLLGRRKCAEFFALFASDILDGFFVVKSSNLCVSTTGTGIKQLPAYRYLEFIFSCRYGFQVMRADK